MNAVDTNVFVYYFDPTEPVKQAKAVALFQGLMMAPASTVLHWQVLGEFAKQMRGWQDKGRITRAEFLNHVSAVRGFFPLALPTPNVLDLALDLSGRYSLSHWDSMILGACKEASVTTLYTEDMGAPTTYDGIQVINPFV
jgi:predicted nucleic acid-binding protein